MEEESPTAQASKRWRRTKDETGPNPEALEQAQSKIKSLEHKLSYQDWTVQNDLVQAREDYAEAVIAGLYNKLEALSERARTLEFAKKYRAVRVGLLKAECDSLLNVHESQSTKRQVTIDENVEPQRTEPSAAKSKPTSESSSTTKLKPSSEKRKSIKPPKEKVEEKSQRLSTASNAGLKKLATPSRSSLNNRGNSDSDSELTPVSRPRRSIAMTPTNTYATRSASKSRKSNAQTSSSSKALKSKPRFSNKGPATMSNPFAAFDLTTRVAAPKLKSN